MTSKVAHWFGEAAVSFARSEAHHENLGYLRGSEFSFDRAWEQTLSCFEEVTELVADGWPPKTLVIRAIVPLGDAPQLVVAVPEMAALLPELSTMTPPTIVVCPPALTVNDRRRFQEYRVDIATDLDAAMTYTASRSLDFPDQELWTRSLMLERF